VGSGLLFIAIEEIRARFPFGGFSWGLLGFSQVDGPLVRAAPLGSTPLVGMLVVMIGVLTSRVIIPPGAGGTRFFARMLAAASATALPVLTILLPVATYAENGTLRVGAVQGNVPRPPIGWPDQPLQVTANHRDETLRLLSQHQDVDLIVWPESAADLDPRTDPAAAEILLAAVSAADPTPILVGTQQFFDKTRINQHVAFGLNDGALTQLGEYTKQHPVPFGEYIPHRDFFARFSREVDQVQSDMVPGSEPAVMSLPRDDGQVVLGDVICFEIAFADVVRQAVTHGAQLLIVPTNNASFGDSGEAAQQTQITRFRAIEYSRAAVQASTVGISALIDGRGRILADTQMWQADHLVADMPLRTTQTWAARLGLAPTIVSWVGALAWIVVSVVRRGNASARRHPHVQRTRESRTDCPAGTFMR
ncbi:MAG: apolipoprotein N-acyltransferase, partial [Bowdeniella nasicola]|nr:apolipoprotein N-acyltransferase [Bowdeniella nasicola]